MNPIWGHYYRRKEKFTVHKLYGFRTASEPTGETASTWRLKKRTWNRVDRATATPSFLPFTKRRSSGHISGAHPRAINSITSDTQSNRGREGGSQGEAHTGLFLTHVQKKAGQKPTGRILWKKWRGRAIIKKTVRRQAPHTCRMPFSFNLPTSFSFRSFFYEVAFEYDSEWSRPPAAMTRPVDLSVTQCRFLIFSILFMFYFVRQRCLSCCKRSTGRKRDAEGGRRWNATKRSWVRRGRSAFE